MTVVINLFGAPCSGKSTAAAGIFYELKKNHVHCEMVREYIKSWAWEGRKPNAYDQMFLLGKQSKYESMLYGKVDFIVTDSPILLSGFYDQYYANSTIVADAAMAFTERAKANGITYLNFWLHGHNRYDARGRNQEQEEAEVLAVHMKAWLDSLGVDIIDVDGILDDRVSSILNEVSKWGAVIKSPETTQNSPPSRS